MTKLVIFDFDGTIADSFGVILDAFKKLVPNMQNLSDKEIEILRNKPYKDIVDYFGISYFRVPSLIVKGRQMLRRSIDHVEPFPGIATSLAKLKKDGYKLCIISSNATQNIEHFLDKHTLRSNFDIVKGNVGLLGKPKLIRAIRRQLNYHANDVIYVGDEPRDIDAAHKAQVFSIAVSWGFAGREILAKQNPTLIVDSTRELSGAIKEISE